MTQAEFIMKTWATSDGHVNSIDQNPDESVTAKYDYGMNISHCHRLSNQIRIGFPEYTETYLVPSDNALVEIWNMNMMGSGLQSMYEHCTKNFEK